MLTSPAKSRLFLRIAVALFIASLAFAHRADDWSKFNHRTFKIIQADSCDSLLIEISAGETDHVKLLGIEGTDASRAWLTDHASDLRATLLLQSPQTRDASNSLRAFVYIDNQNLSVELVKAGLAYADRREKTLMDGLIDPAEAEARKKKRGMWKDLRYEQMPAWRRDWLRSFFASVRLSFEAQKGC